MHNLNKTVYNYISAFSMSSGLLSQIYSNKISIETTDKRKKKAAEIHRKMQGRQDRKTEVTMIKE